MAGCTECLYSGCDFEAAPAGEKGTTCGEGDHELNALARASAKAGMFPCVRIVSSWSMMEIYIILVCKSMPQ